MRIVVVALITTLLASTARADEGLEEVTVRGGKATPRTADVTEELGQAEVRQLPGAFGDPWRAMEVAPGVTPILSGLPYFYVRGAPPGNVGYAFDGVRVPYLFHFGLGPAVVHPALIARTDVYEGGYPASLGRFAGGYVTGESMPPKDYLHGEGQIRLVDAGGLVEAPFADGRGAVLAAGRYGYTAALFSLLDSDTSLDYRDYQVRVAYALSDRDTISLLGFGAYDFAAQKQLIAGATLAAASGTSATAASGRVERTLFASEFHRADLRWDRTLGGGGQLRVAATLGYDRTRVEARRAGEDVMTSLRATYEQRASHDVLVRLGGDVTVDQYDGDPLPKYADDDEVVARQALIFAAHTDYALGPWLDMRINLAPGAVLEPGVRFDMFGSEDVRALGVDPRLSGRFAVTDKLRIVLADGLATQPPSTPIALPAITIARLTGGLQRSLQTSGGVEVDLPEDITATVIGFRNAFFDLNDALGTAQVEIIDLEKSDALLRKSRGAAYGLELGAKRKLSRRVSGLLTYTLSRSTREQDNRSFVSAYDRTHVVNAALSYDLGKSWRIGGRYVFYTGTPVTPLAPAYPGQLVGQPPDRTPPFQRLDVRLEKRWRMGERGWVAAVFEALNATLSREVTGYACDRGLPLPGRPTPGCQERVIGPISIPSVGIEGGF